MPALVLPLVAALGGVLINIVGTLVGRALLALGMGVVAYTGADTTLTWLKAQVLQNLQQIPPNLLSMLALMKVGVCINIMISAILVRMTINGLQSGTFKRWVLR
jgi:ABC-type transport system involved in cytochrome bd biosynthesis fused ATPase/permease subunit